MSQFRELDSLLNPVTALAFVPLQCSTLLFAGEGPFLRVYEHGSSRCLVSERIFNSQSIHGIIYFDVSSRFSSEGSHTFILVWGARSICLLLFSGYLDKQSQPVFEIKRLSSIIRTDDWILGASFQNRLDQRPNPEISLFHVVVITSNNCVQGLTFEVISTLECLYKWRLRNLTAGPKSMLYSAHIIWLSAGRGLVAAGTVFGDVLVWSFHSDAISFNPDSPVSSFLHFVFQGHEGSVFGVRISGEPTDSFSTSAGRCVASCSDDRTIRIWDISQIDMEIATRRLDQKIEDNFSPRNGEETSSLPMATTMGHTARIWGLRFLRHSQEDSLILSFGEDATSQIWHLRAQPDAMDSGKVTRTWVAHLQHECTFEYHAKKNIWSAAVHTEADGSYIVSTGGADGRIVCFDLDAHILRTGESRATEWTMSSVLEKLIYAVEAPDSEDTMAAKTQARISPENVFTALRGHWKLYRRLQSEICTYPSGTFKGMASFEMRTPTDPAYDTEYLYTETGEFCTEQGLIFPATRRYVYRFQRNTNTISTWFVKAEDGSSVDYLFHRLKFSFQKKESYCRTKGSSIFLLEADGQHLCIDDDYQATYFFKFQGCQCHEWDLKYNVKGPRKAYNTNTQYIRHGPQKAINENPQSDIVLGTSLKSGGRKRTGNGNVISDVGAFKTYTWIGQDQLLVSTTQGYLLVGDLSVSGTEEHEMAKNQTISKGFWAEVGQLADMATSCLATNIQYPGLALLTGRERIIYFYQYGKHLTRSHIELPDKVTYMRSHFIASCGNEIFDHSSSKIKLGIIASCVKPLAAYSFYVDVDLRIPAYSVSLSLVLRLFPNFVVTSSCFINMKDIVILGSRNGALAIYEVSAEATDNMSIAPSLVLPDIHAKDTITGIENLPVNISDSHRGTYILSTGKDGTYSIHQILTARRGIEHTFIGFQTVHVCKPPFGPNIEGACFNRASQELWLWGFSSKDFVVWNESRKARIMTVECGGAHRNWAFLPGNDEDAGGNFAWTKASSCRIYSQPRASHQVLQHGGHGRELKAAAISPLIKGLDGRMARYVATGAEDTAIRIFHASRVHEVQGANQGFRCLGVFTKHTTGIQQLRWSSNGELLFSAAGCEEFFVWHVRPVPSIEIGMMCEAICPPVTESADLRIMSFDIKEIENRDEEAHEVNHYLVSMVYSDSSVRVYSYDANPTNPKFHLISTGTYLTYCLTQALYLPFNSSIHLCTASTDGHISFWSLTDPLAEKGILTTPHGSAVKLSTQIPLSSSSSSSSTNPTHLTYHSRTKIHQSSIKTISSLPLSPSSYLIATGGDDGALGFTRVTHRSNSSPSPPSSNLLTSSVLLIPNAHAAAITAITYLGRHPVLQTDQCDETYAGMNPRRKKNHHVFATTGPDQRLQTWFVRIDLGKEGGVEGLEVERGKRGVVVDTAVADVACLEGFGDGFSGGLELELELELGGDDDDDEDGENGNEDDNHPEKEKETKNEKSPSKDSRRIRENSKNRVLVAGIGMEVWEII